MFLNFLGELVHTLQCFSVPPYLVCRVLELTHMGLEFILWKYFNYAFKF